jgi:hypothetical protein
MYILGHGNQSCGSWLQARRSESWPALVQQGWLSGYVTAFNNYASRNGNISAGTDVDGLFAWVDNYCQSHPLDSLFGAGGALIRDPIGVRDFPIPHPSNTANPRPSARCAGRGRRPGSGLSQARIGAVPDAGFVQAFGSRP